MKARPILFSGPMVRALLEGRKTQTRRAVRNVDPEEHGFVGTFDERGGLPVIVFSDAPGDQVLSRIEAKCPYGKPGDLLWVRETFGHFYRGETPEACVFIADAGTERWPQGKDYEFAKATWSRSWRPSIHMPRWASRLTLEVTEVRVEQLWMIGEADALAEGITQTETDCDGRPWYSLPEWQWQSLSPVLAYRKLWESINGEESWELDPWVWVIAFRVHRCNVDVLLKARAA